MSGIRHEHDGALIFMMAFQIVADRHQAAEFAMRARGWESGARRTSYRADILRESDAAKTCGVVVLALLCAFLAVVACGQWSFYPVMPALVCWWGYAPYAALMLLPAAAAVAERIRWRGLE